MLMVMIVLLFSMTWAQDPHLPLKQGLAVFSHEPHSVTTLNMARYDVPTTSELWRRFMDETDETKMLVQAELLVQRTTADWPDDYRGEFLWGIAPAALISAKNNGIYPSVVLAQGILESGWGSSPLAKTHNNLFGMKGKKGFRSVEVNTLESIQGKVVRQKAYFRCFDSWGESIAYHGRLLGSSHYYQFAKPVAEDAKHYLRLIGPVYASQPGYAEYVGAIIDSYQLDRWDDMVLSIQDW